MQDILLTDMLCLKNILLLTHKHQSKTKDVIFITSYHNWIKLLYRINVNTKSKALKTNTLILTHKHMLLSIMLNSQLTAFEIQGARSSEVLKSEFTVKSVILSIK